MTSINPSVAQITTRFIKNTKFLKLPKKRKAGISRKFNSPTAIFHQEKKYSISKNIIIIILIQRPAAKATTLHCACDPLSSFVLCH